jgi:antitoxin component of MazEF toxin-antitoxin module
MAGKVQKIQKVGNSAGVLLPADWLAARGLKPGSRVRLEVTDQRVVIHPEPKDREVGVDAKFARDVRAFLKRNAKILERLS